MQSVVRNVTSQSAPTSKTYWIALSHPCFQRTSVQILPLTPIVAEQVSLQALTSLAGGLYNALSIPSGVSLQDAGALLALRLTNTEQELSSALSLLRKYTSGSAPATRLSAAPR